ncbi:hypothetical protein D3C86_2015260 [compost metagenome]
MIVCTTNATALNFNNRLGVSQCSIEYFKSVLAALLLDLLEGAVNDAFGNRLLAVDHHNVHELGQILATKLRIRQDIALRDFSASWHFNSFNLFS